MSAYSARGVSAQKEEVHSAIAGLEKGLFPRAFCQLYPDLLGGDEDWVTVMHADGAGTKSILAYLYWRETGDVSVWRGIAQDAIVMNTDDLLCVGITDRLAYSSSIDRNKHRIPGEVLREIIQGGEAFLEVLRSYGIDIVGMGGETADVGDAVRTVTVNGTMAARWPKKGLITNDAIAPGQVIIGLSSAGQTVYESEYNSGMGSNGLTSARHDLLHKHYAIAHPETVETLLPEEVVYNGVHRLSDGVDVPYRSQLLNTTIGKLVLSPTRTYLPFAKALLENRFDAVKGLIHCSGGGQTKCAKYMRKGIRIVKDNLPPSPPLFDLIQKGSGSDLREMYQVFNMGVRLEIYTEESAVGEIIEEAARFGIEASVIGRVTDGASGVEVDIRRGKESILYKF